MTRISPSEVVGALRDYYAEHRVMPSYATLSELAGIKAKSWTHTLVSMLKDEGILDVTPDKRLKPGRRFFEREVASSVRAGNPEHAPGAGIATDALTIDSYLIEHPSKTSLVRVKGDSMIDAGILEGDLAVVEWRSNARPGDVVVAMVDGELTLKTLAKDKHGYWLQPANPAYERIRANDKLEISGVMVGLIRKL